MKFHFGSRKNSCPTTTTNWVFGTTKIPEAWVALDSEAILLKWFGQSTLSYGILPFPFRICPGHCSSPHLTFSQFRKPTSGIQNSRLVSALVPWIDFTTGSDEAQYQHTQDHGTKDMTKQTVTVPRYIILTSLAS